MYLFDSHFTSGTPCGIGASSLAVALVMDGPGQFSYTGPATNPEAFPNLATLMVPDAQ